MKKRHRWGLRAFVAGGVLAALQCQASQEETEILLLITSRAAVDQLQVVARNIQGDDDTLLEEVGDVDILDEPVPLLLRPSTATPDGGTAPIAAVDADFLVHIVGTLDDGTPVASWGGLLRFTPNAREVVELTLTAEHLGCDGDGDGFQDCRCTLTPEQEAICDCADSNRFVNQFVVEVCTDQIDNNCSGYPPNENCPCEPGAERACTKLLEADLHKAGIGQCHFGVQVCGPDGTWPEECDSGTPADGDQPGDGIDNDCNGTVDQGSSCATGELRDCLLGLIDQPARDRAVGECVVGRQRCEGGQWGDCLNEVRPSQIPGAVGWEEADTQCDGLDNDCDGLYDESPFHDQDGDGYTNCGTCRLGSTACPGTCDANPTRGVPWLCDEEIDCNEDPTLVYMDSSGRLCDPNQDPSCTEQVSLGWAINPGRQEDCRRVYIESDGTYVDVDEDCRCYHSQLGRPTYQLSGGTNCPAADAQLNCAREPDRRCSDSALPGPYFYGFNPNSNAGDCYYCDALYGKECNEDTGACFTKQEWCENEPCGSQRGAAPAYSRPPCCFKDDDFCVPNTPDTGAPFAWTCPIPADGLDENNECDPQQCDADSAVPWFHGIDNTVPDAPVCYYKADVPGICDGTLDPPACYDRDAECAAAGPGLPFVRTAAQTCLKPDPSTCTGTTPPVFNVPVPTFEDPFNECPGTCNGRQPAACLRQPGQTASNQNECDEHPDFPDQHLFLVDGVCCLDQNCPDCYACGASGRCEPIDAEDDGACSDDCTQCVQGTCTDRPAGDFTECPATCQACDAAGAAGNCAPYTGANGRACAGVDTFCCAGTCVNPPGNPSEFGLPCTAADPACNGYWRCNGTAAECDGVGNPCDYCVGDFQHDAACGGPEGMTCTDINNAVECTACYSCLDGGDTTSCVAPGGVNDYDAGDADNQGSLVCTNLQRCDGAGNCKLDLGQPCSASDDCVSGNCVDNVCCDVSACGECERCDTGSCLPIANAAGDPGVGNTPDTCVDDCTYCFNGACVNRGAGDFQECSGTCVACTTAGGNCGPYTGTAGRNCNATTSFCCAGDCETGVGELGDACGSGDCDGQWQCDAVLREAECSTRDSACAACGGDSRYAALCDRFGTCPTTGSPVQDCPACSTCQYQPGSTSCVARAAGDDDVNPLTCNGTQTCNDTGSCLLALGEACTTDGQCASALCVDGFCCATATCGECERCTGANGTCQNITAQGDPGDDPTNPDTCVDDCTHCVTGACQPRPRGDFTECTGECVACDSSGGNCAPYDGTGGRNCSASGTFCCAGSCVSPGGIPTPEYNQQCGDGADCNGVWGCSANQPRCDSYDDVCAECNGDEGAVSTCTLAFGTQCDVATPTLSCPACQSCVDGGTTLSCSANGDGNDYGLGVEDPNTPGLCEAPTNACDGAGNCRLEDGEACSVGPDCVSGNCVEGICCAQACAECESCADGSTCSPDLTQDGAACGTDNDLCCGGTCVDPGGTLGDCGTGDCASTWQCVGGAVQCGADLTRPCGRCGTGTGASPNVDTIDAGECSASNGADCDFALGTDVECPECNICQSTSGTESCVPAYENGIDDVGPNTCGPAAGDQCTGGTCG